MSKHRRPSISARTAAKVGVGVAAVAVAVPLLAAGSASAASVATWDRVAQCESSGNWSNHDTGGNGHYGGLQFSPSSWALAGGLTYADRADHATKDQQIAVAEQLLKMQGQAAWECAYAGNLASGGPAPAINTNSSNSGSGTAHTGGAVQAPTPVRAQHEPNRQALPTAAERSSGSYTVAPGDTLSGIAAAHHINDWHKLHELNKTTIKDADLIFPGQHLKLS
jgi:nucleoid-associated protein YgaU